MPRGCAQSPAPPTSLPCSCFDLCTQRSASNFLAHLGLLNDPKSPWVEYLQVVYGGPPPALPLDLSGFNFFYSHDTRWPANVEWPMSSCYRGTAVQPLQCSPRYCARWALKPSPGSFTKSNKAVVSMPNKECSTRAGIVYGVRSSTENGIKLDVNAEHEGVGDALIKLNQRILGHTTYGDGAWVEVIRQDDAGYNVNRGRHLEGWREYGCWLYVVRGSGIWLNLGRTATIHNKFYVDDLTRRWYAEAKVNHTERAAQWNDAPRVYEHFPRIAYDLGLDTIQNQFRDTDLYTKRPWMEVVVTKRTCMHPELESPPITETFRTCPRRQMSLFTGWGEASLASVAMLESFDAQHRGWGMGALIGMAGAGAGFGLALLGYIDVLPFGWRFLYVVGTVRS